MRLFSTEAVSKYHPDKYADQISDAILTECLKQDRQSHCGIETMVGQYRRPRRRNHLESGHQLRSDRPPCGKEARLSGR